MTSAPPMMDTSLPSAASRARAIASSKPFTNVNAAVCGGSSGRCVTTKNGTPNGLWPPHASAASYMFRPTTTAPAARHRLVEKFLVRARRLASRLLVVAPRAAEDPIVQSLAALAQAAARPVVRPGDVTVKRGRDACRHLRHRSS